MRLTQFTIGNGVNSLVAPSRPLVIVPAAREGSWSRCDSRLGAAGGGCFTLFGCRSGRSGIHLVDDEQAGDSTRKLAMRWVVGHGAYNLARCGVL